MDNDVIVVGAGLAGLLCADRLAAAGHTVTVLESSDDVGGRQRTDAVDGFLLDRGFQVVNPAYPALRRWVSLEELDLQAFGAGLTVRRESSLATLAHPLREPTALPAMLRSGLLSPREVLGLVRWLGPTLVDPRRTISGPDRSRAEGLDRAGVRGRLRREVIDPFLAGVVAESDGETSDAFTKLLARMFALGVPALPARGIQALPHWLSAHARRRGLPVTVTCQEQVVKVTETADGVSVETAAGHRHTARAAVVAVGPQHVADLVPLPRPRTRGLRTWWFSADEPPTPSTMLTVDGRRCGPVVNAGVISNVAPSWAPGGKHLIQASCLLDSSTPRPAEQELEVRRQAGEMLSQPAPSASQKWELIRCDSIEDALPAQPPPLRTVTPPAISARIFVAGDHRDTASIQGALASGARVARTVVETLHVG